MRRALLLAGSAALMIATPALAEDAAVESASVAEVVVTARAQRLYRTEETTVGKVAEDPLNIPQAVQVINAELISDLGARDVTDLYRNISGVSFFSYAGVTFRGFRQEQAYYDGLRGNPFIGFSVPQLFNIERVEVLKGPAGMLYGPGSPGGVINYVSKTPQPEFSGTLSAVGGNYDRRGLSGEVAGPLDGAGRFSGRAGVFFEEKDSFRVNAGSETAIFDLGLTTRPTDDLDLTLQATRYDQDLPGARLRGVPVDNAGEFLAPISWNHNEATDYASLTANVAQARLVGRLNEAIRFDATVRGFRSKEKQNYHEPRALVDTNRDGRIDLIRREFRDQRREAEGLSAGVNVVAEAQAFGLEHKLLVGADGSREDALFLGRTAVGSDRRGPVPDLSLVNPVYGLGGAIRYNLQALTYAPSDTRSTRWGAYLQDQISFGEQWMLVGGLRYDRYEDVNRLTAADYEDSDLTYRVGLIFKPRPDVSLYASWADVFEPQDAASQDAAVGGPFAPVTGEQIEAGVKTALFGGRLQASAAVYQIVRSDLLQVDPSRAPVNGRDQLAPIGEVTSEGFEFDLAADLSDNWVVTVNYGYNDTRVTGTAPGQALTNAVGDRFANAPKHKLGVWTRYQIPALDAAVALGAEHVSERVSLSGQRVKPYTVFDATLIKDFAFAQLRLRVKNLFDETYAASGFNDRGGHFPGEPRTWFIEARRSF